MSVDDVIKKEKETKNKYLISKASTNSDYEDVNFFICTLDKLNVVIDCEKIIKDNKPKLSDSCELTVSFTNPASYWEFYEEISTSQVFKKENYNEDILALKKFINSKKDYDIIYLNNIIQELEKKEILQLPTNSYPTCTCKVYETYIQFISYPKYDDFEVFTSEINIKDIKKYIK